MGVRPLPGSAIAAAGTVDGRPRAWATLPSAAARDLVRRLATEDAAPLLDLPLGEHRWPEVLDGRNLEISAGDLAVAPPELG